MLTAHSKSDLSPTSPPKAHTSVRLSASRKDCAVNAPFGVSQTKNLLNAALGIGELRQHMTTEIRTQVLCSLTDDVGEGISAALQRRAPAFSNR